MNEQQTTQPAAGEHAAQQVAATQQQAQQPQQQQAQLNLQPAKRAPKSDPAISPKELATLMADNERMKSRLQDLEKTQSTEAREKMQADRDAAIDVHRAKAEQAQAAADAAIASARRNAVKAHFRGSLKSDSYLALMPAVEFNSDGDLTAESIEGLNTFRDGHAELFNAPSTATTAMSASGASSTADAYSEAELAAMRINKIATPGSDRHWSQRKNADALADFVGFAKIGGNR